MKVRASIKKRNADCKIVRRKGHLYVINKKDPKMKIISLVIASKPPFATIEVENYYDGNLLTDAKGEIESSKEDSRLHGLGIKSMKRILETYDGYMKIKTEDNIFDLFMAMPLKEENEVHADNS